MAETATGTVVRNTGSHYIVETADGRELPAKVKGRFRINGIRTTNPVAVGDIVDCHRTDDPNVWLIYAIHPRRNYIIRRASNLSKESHIIAANIDLAALVVTLAEPATSTVFIDRFLATAEAYNVPAALIINKTDLEQKLDISCISDNISNIVYISAVNGEGHEELVKAVEEIAGMANLNPSEGILSNERQRLAVSNALNSIKEAENALSFGMTFDAVTVSLEDAISELLELTGEKTSDEVIDRVFHNFCVGK